MSPGSVWILRHLFFAGARSGFGLRAALLTRLKSLPLSVSFFRFSLNSCRHQPSVVFGTFLSQ